MPSPDVVASDQFFRFHVRRAVPRILRLVLLAEAALVVGDYVFNFLDVAGDIRIRRIFNVAREESIPTWFSSS